MMLWSDFVAKVLVDLPVDNERIGIATGNPNFLAQQIIHAVTQIQQQIKFYQQGHETVYGPDDLVVEGRASVGTLPAVDECRPQDAYYKKVGKQCMSQPMQPYDWGSRYDLICGNARITKCQFLIAIDPWGNQFTMFPSVGENHQLSLTWSGVKTVFADTDNTPFDQGCIEAVGLFVKAKIARLVDHDLAEYNSYMGEWKVRKALLHGDAQERKRLALTATSPSPNNRCANAVSVCADRGGACFNPEKEREDTVEFIAFGDSSDADQTNTNAVSILVKSLEPDFVMHMGDCNYPHGDPVTIQDNLIKFYGLYIPKNFYLSFGNHDIETDGGAALKALLTRQAAFNQGLSYYDFIPGGMKNQFEPLLQDPGNVDGKVHVFVLDSNGDPLVQGPWLQSRLSQSALWNIVVLHTPPYSSDILHAPGALQWRLPYKDWGAHAVISGHGHNYERLLVDGLPYFVCGLGGAPSRPFVNPPTPGSQFRYNAFYGCMYITGRHDRLQLTFYDTKGDAVDSVAIEQKQVFA